MLMHDFADPVYYAKHVLLPVQQTGIDLQKKLDQQDLKLFLPGDVDDEHAIDSIVVVNVLIPSPNAMKYTTALLSVKQ